MPELLYGGARGGGKSEFLLGDYCTDCELGAEWRGVIFRRSYPELEELMARSQSIVPQCWPGSEWWKSEKTWRIPTGATLRMRSLETPEDASHYQGHEYSWIGWDELGAWPNDRAYKALMATLRSTGNIPHKRVRATANPGGPGHGWVKSRFIDPAPAGYEIIRDADTGMARVFIPARVTDNLILLAKDPTYIDRLRGVGSPELVRAWLEGDWTVVAGAFFPEFSMQRHVIAPRRLPEHWARFRSFDWGSARPFSVGWWAVSDGTLHDIPRGCLVRYREWYGMKPGEPNVGLRMTAEQVAQGILDREVDEPEPIAIGVADPAIFAEDGGPSIARRMVMQGVVFRPADNKRVPQRGAMGGWDQLRSRLIGDEDGKPMLLFFNTCKDLIRTLPALQHDDMRPEDVDCWVAGTMISTPDGERPIEAVMPGDIVDTPIGPRPVLRAYLSGTSETVRVMLSDGRALEGTPHHKIYIRGCGLVALADLQCHMIPSERIIWSRSLNTVVSCIAATKGAATTIRAAASSLGRKAQAFIGRSGLMPATAFQTAGMSTTSMATTTTTTFPIWPVYLEASTTDTTCKSGWARMVTLDKGSRHGVALQQASDNCGRTLPRCWPTHRSGNARADIVAVLLRRDTLRRLSVALNVKRLCQTLCVRFAGRRSTANPTGPSACGPVRISAVGRSGERTQVYNLTVADAHLFYANGVLSSNSNMEDHAPDEVRYACMSYPFIHEAPTVQTHDSWARAFAMLDQEDVRGWRVA